MFYPENPDNFFSDPYKKILSGFIYSYKSSIPDTPPPQPYGQLRNKETFPENEDLVAFGWKKTKC